jgi:CHAD domain-containing protein
MVILAHGHEKSSDGADEEQLGSQLLWRVGAEALRKQLAHSREQLAPARAGDDAEAIHQMRVALRRLRTMARLLGETPAFRGRRVARLRRQAQPLARRLGDVRDLDMLLKRLDEYVCSTGEAGQESTGLRDLLVARREKALRRLRKELRRPATRTLLGHPRRATRRLIARSHEGRRMLVRQVAGSALWSRYEAILGFADAVANAGPTERLHALRIACKHLRYAIELFSQEDDPRAQSLLATLKGAQDHLGELQDRIFAIALLERLRSALPQDALLADFLALQEEEREALRHGFAPCWEQLTGAPFRQELAALIAAL